MISAISPQLQTRKNTRALCFYDLPSEINHTMFRYELENYGSVQKLIFPEKEGKWDQTAFVSFLYDTDAEKLFYEAPKLSFCGIHLKVRWGYFPDEQ